MLAHIDFFRPRMCRSSLMYGADSDEKTVERVRRGSIGGFRTHLSSSRTPEWTPIQNGNSPFTQVVLLKPLTYFRVVIDRPYSELLESSDAFVALSSIISISKIGLLLNSGSVDKKQLASSLLRIKDDRNHPSMSLSKLRNNSRARLVKWKLTDATSVIYRPLSFRSILFHTSFDSRMTAYPTESYIPFTLNSQTPEEREFSMFVYLSMLIVQTRNYHADFHLTNSVIFVSVSDIRVSSMS
jgi:hypothetical protein